MSGISILLDTNVVIEILKAAPSIMILLENEQLEFDNCAVSQITRMELLSYPNLEATEELAIRNFLDRLVVFKLDERIEQEAIAFRRNHSVKLPDAIIAATAKIYNLRLLTFDQQLHTKFTAYIAEI